MSPLALRVLVLIVQPHFPSKTIMNAPMLVDAEYPFKQVVSNPQDEKQVIGADGDKALLECANVAQSFAKEPKKLKKILWILAAVAIAAIVSAVVAPIVITQQRQPYPSKYTEPEPEHTETELAETERGPESNDTHYLLTHANHSLAATSYSVASIFQARLVYQTGDGYLQAVEFNASTGSWRALAENFTKAKPHTPLALTSVIRQNVGDMQFNAFYIDEQNRICEWIWNSQVSNTGKAGVLDEKNIITHLGSKLAAYWPIVLYTDAVGQLRELYWQDDWKERDEPLSSEQNLSTSEGGAIAIVPASSLARSMNVFFRGAGGTLRQFNRNSTGQYKTDPTMLSHPIPEWSSISSFALPNVPNSRLLDTFFLCQDVSDNIAVRRLEGADPAWKGNSSPVSFQNAEKQTGISCTTMYTGEGSMMTHGSQMPRCYFVVDGKIREVELDYATKDFRLLGDIKLS